MTTIIPFLLGCNGGEGYEVTDTTLYNQVRVGDHAVCALAADNYLHCWGKGSKSAPTDIELSSFDIQENHGCAVTMSGEGICWGWLDGATGEEQNALLVPDEPVSAVATADDSTCWLTTEGQATCSGNNNGGQTVPPTQALASISGGGQYYCATTVEDGLLTCWGSDQQDRDVPAVVPLAYDAGSGGATCLIDNNGKAICYDLSALSAEWPVPFSPEGTFKARGSNSELCFVYTDGSAYCAYDSWDGCGEFSGPFHAISAEAHRYCAALDSGGILCWIEDPDRVHEPDNCLVGEPSSLPLTE